MSKSKDQTNGNLRTSLWLVCIISRIVPQGRREDWRREWEAEIYHLFTPNDSGAGKRPAGMSTTRLSAHVLGALRDAIWFQQQRLWEIFLKDLVHGQRMMIEKPGFTVVAVLTLALALGATASLFSAVSAVFRQSIPYYRPEAIVLLTEQLSGDPNLQGVAIPDYYDWKTQSRTIEEFGVYFGQNYNLTGEGEPARVSCLRASASMFSVLGIKPIVGRFFSEDESGGALRYAVITHSFWQSRFGGSPAVLQKSIELDGERLEIIGVLPAEVKVPFEGIDLWVPLATNGTELESRERRFAMVIGRLRAGATLAQAQKEMQEIARTAEQKYVGNAGWTIKLTALQDLIFNEQDRLSFGLLGLAVVFVLMMACANVANMLLARMTIRRREFAIRRSLGATRLRLVRQLLTESFLLGVMGAAGGLLLAFLITHLLLTLTPRFLETKGIAINQQTADFTLAVSLLTSICFGSGPALLAATTSDPLETIEKRGSVDRPWKKWQLHDFLVIGEVAIALMLLSGTVLIIRSYLHVRQIDLGFHASDALTLRLDLPEKSYPGAEQVRAFYTNVTDKLSGTSGVNEFGATNNLPLTGGGTNRTFVIENKPTSANDIALTSYRVTAADYFRAMEIEIRQGRVFNIGDTSQTTHVAVINENMAHRFWPRESPLGQRIKFIAPPDQVQPPWLTIIGIVADVKHNGYLQNPMLETYVPLSQAHEPTRGMTFVIRTDHDPREMLVPVMRAIHELNPDLPLANVATLREIKTYETEEYEAYILALGMFAAMATGLAAVGIYGIMSYTVAYRTREFCLRLALGASHNDILVAIFKRGSALTGLGISLGLVGATGFAFYLSHLSSGVNVFDPASYAGVVLLLFGIAMVACYFPARRVTHLDVAAALLRRE